MLYELVHNNNEVYWPLGLFLSLEDAINAVGDYYLKHKHPPYEDRYETDHIALEIRERVVGMSVDSKVVWSMSWEEAYDEENDLYYWEKA